MNMLVTDATKNLCKSLKSVSDISALTFLHLTYFLQKSHIGRTFRKEISKVKLLVKHLIMSVNCGFQNMRENGLELCISIFYRSLQIVY